MTRGLFALIWLGVVMLAGGYLASRVSDGLGFRTDLMALLPREEQDPVLQHANDAVSSALARRKSCAPTAPANGRAGAIPT